MGMFMFKGCTGITTFTFATGTTVIPVGCFFNCSNLVTADFTNCRTTLELIDDYAFYGCASLRELILPTSTYSLGENVFVGCISLESIDLSGTGIYYIEAYAFKDCEKLTSIILPNVLAGIGEYAFAGCTRLTTITIPQSVGIDAVVQESTYLVATDVNDSNYSTYYVPTEVESYVQVEIHMITIYTQSQVIEHIQIFQHLIIARHIMN